MKKISLRVAAIVVSVFSLCLVEPQAWSSNTVYMQTNLVSNIPGLAQSTDPGLRNPWGLSFSATSPFWVSDAGSNLSTLYSGTGSTVVSTIVVSVPGGPTGTIQNSTTNDFILSNGRKASFVFSTLSGSIYSWNAGAVAEQSASVANASFTGLALGSTSAGNFLYAANTAGTGSIEVFSANFTHVTLAGSFKDPNLTSSPFAGGMYVPHNIQNINGQLYVEYANFQQGLGAVSIFDMNGNFIKELIAPGGPQLNEPWGIVIAPAGFGSFGSDLLVGNLGDGKINAFDPNTGAFIGTVAGVNGPIVNSGLWALAVRTGGTFDPNAVYFAAGINNQKDGLFGVITAVSAATVALTTPSSLPAGTIGTAYTQTLAVTGGTAPYSSFTITNGALPPGLSLDSKTGTISGTPVGIGGTFSFTLSVKDSTGATGVGSLQLTIQQPSVATPLARIGGFAQLASGGGWKTTMTLINTSNTTVNAQINLYADNGTPLTLPLTFPEFGSSLGGSSVGVTLTPNDSVVIQTAASTSSINVGWADVSATGQLSGYLSFSSGSGEGTMLLDTRLSTSLLLPYDNTNGYQTAVALANQGSSPQTITATVFDASGAQLTSSQINLPAFGHVSFFVPTQFAKAAGQLGIIQFQSSAGLTGLGLHFSPTGSFASIPILR
jgi:uncharacterized protein (TIGR03118 family)